MTGCVAIWQYFAQCASAFGQVKRHVLFVKVREDVERNLSNGTLRYSGEDGVTQFAKTRCSGSSDAVYTYRKKRLLIVKTSIN